MSILIVGCVLLFVTRGYSSANRALRRSEELVRVTLLMTEKLFDIETLGLGPAETSKGDFTGDKNFSWQIDSREIEGSEIRLAGLSVFNKNRKDDPGYRLWAYSDLSQP